MNIRLTFLLVSILIIFGGTFLVVKLTEEPERTQNQPWLYKVEDSDIKHIEVTHDGKTVHYNKNPGSLTWFIQEDATEIPVFNDKWSGTPLLLSGPRVNRKLAETFENPSEFGLDPPLTVVKVTERSDIVYEFHIGSATPDGQNQYIRLVGAPALFTVPQIWAEVINRLALEPPYPPEGEEEPTSG